MNTYFRQITEFVRRLPMQQRLVIGAVVVGAVVVLGSVMWWANQPDYALLFGNLSQADAGQVVENLKGRGTNYELRDNGSAVHVPRDEVYELRLSLASSGVVTDGQQGYELFDRGTLGMTDFIQRVSLRRALEGELTRTISSLRQVETARVHLVTPERRAFQEVTVRPSASVLLRLAGGSSLGHGQVEGIASLVAGAVEGLEPADVNVLDTNGNVLYSGDEEDNQTTLSSSQLEMQRNVEEGLVEKGQSMLEDMVGPGNSIVRISASLDFSRTVSNREIIDPESATVVSEEKIDERIDQEIGANSSIRNFELSRTTETHEKSVGSIDHLTVSVILNQRAEEPVIDDAQDAQDGPLEPVFRTYTQQELTDIQNLVQNAVGFDPSRGDKFAIHQTRFEAPSNNLADELDALEKSDRMALYMRYGLIALALVMAFLLIRKAGQQVTNLANQPRLPTPDSFGSLGSFQQGRLLPSGEDLDEQITMDDAPEMAPAGAGMSDFEPMATPERLPDQLLAPIPTPDVYSEKLEMDARLRRMENTLFDQVRRLVDAAPDDAAAVIRDWIGKDLAV